MLTTRAARRPSACLVDKVICLNWDRRFVSTSTVLLQNHQIQIPCKIHRSNTDILAALASTVRKDYTAFHYKFQDDPYMLPRNNLEKRSFALAKESGRNAARFFINKYPELFYRDDAEPKVEAFTFKEVYTPDMTFNLKDLEVAIARREVTNSMIAFNKLREQGIEIERNVFLDFFELVAFFNERDVFDADMTEEMWFQREEQGKKTWKDGGLIDQLYGEHESTYPQLTGIYLQALVKHYHMNKAFELYGHAIQSGKPLSLDAYNAVLQTIPYVRQSGQSRYELLIELLKQIAQRKLKPDLQTFNGALAVISRNSRWKGAKNEAQKVLNEMKALSITPTLGTYYYILRIFYHEANDMNDTLPRIIDAIKDKTFVYTCPEDLMFFEMAMRVCEENLQDVDLGQTVNRLFHKGVNHKFVGSAMGESVYYRCFFKVLCKGASVEQLMDHYTKYVPSVYIPEISVFMEILNTLDMYESYEYLPQIWTDLVDFEYARKDILALNVSSLMAKCDSKEATLQEAFCLIAKEIIERYQKIISDEKQAMYYDITNASKVYNNCIVVFDRNQKYDYMLDVLQLMDKDDAVLTVHSDFQSVPLLSRAADHLMQCGSFDKLVFLLNQSAKRNLLDLHRHVNKELSNSTTTLNNRQRDYIQSLINDALPTKSP